MPNQVYTLTQNSGESNADFELRVQTFVDTENYYYASIGGQYPPAALYNDGKTQSGKTQYLGFPPATPSSDRTIWDGSQMLRQVTFTYDNAYYYIFLDSSVPIPPAPPTPANGNIAIWSGGALTDGVLNVDTALPNFTNLTPATAPGQAVEYTQLTSIGTVTSVALSMPAEFGVTGSPITTSGTFNVTWANENANMVFAGPSSGAPAAPSFRSLVSDDIPTLTSSKISDFDTHARWLISGTAPVDYNSTTGVFSMHVADSTHDGYLSSADWNTFNSKQAAGNYITALTGDATAAGPGSAALTLATVNSNVGTFGSATKSVTVTVNAKGLVTAASESTMTPDAGNITGAQNLTKTDDTNVTLTLGGTPTGALLKAVSITAGWSGTLSVSRGGTALSTVAAGSILAANAANTLSAVTSTSGTKYLKNNAGTISWDNFVGGPSTIIFLTGTNNPADATTYYVGMTGVFSTTESQKYFRSIYTGTITALVVYINGTAGSSENVTIKIHNSTAGTTATATTTANWSTMPYNGYFTGLSLAVAAGDFISVQIDTPTWVTNPNSLAGGFQMLYS